MTLRLTVDTARWRADVDHVARRAPGLIPVVKGNGYGFGRVQLAALAAELSDTVAVGTVHELGGLPTTVTPIVLTPTLSPPALGPAVSSPAAAAPVMTVGSVRHVDALGGWSGRVVVKLASSVRRFGVRTDEFGAVVERVRRARLEVVAFAVHPPVAGTDADHADDIADWLTILDPADEVWISHLTLDGYAALHDAWPDRRLRIRLGSALWHGDKTSLHLGADVLDTRSVRAGTRVGYRQEMVAEDGMIVVIGAGTAHGVGPLADGRSPFHFRRQRLALVEPPHMHTSMVFAAPADAPEVGDIVDVQRPLIMTSPDVVTWA